MSEREEKKEKIFYMRHLLASLSLRRKRKSARNHVIGQRVSLSRFSFSLSFGRTTFSGWCRNDCDTREEEEGVLIQIDRLYYTYIYIVSRERTNVQSNYFEWDKDLSFISLMRFQLPSRSVQEVQKKKKKFLRVQEKMFY